MQQAAGAGALGPGTPAGCRVSTSAAGSRRAQAARPLPGSLSLMLADGPRHQQRDKRRNTGKAKPRP